MGAVEKRLGQRVADHRKRVGLTQAQLAEQVGVATETVSRLERGVAVPSLARLDDIASALGIELAEFFRVLDRESPKDRALGRLIAVARRGSAAEISTIADVAELVFSRLGRRS